MNGRKARALRKQAAGMNKMTQTSYTREPYESRRMPIRLDSNCKRAVYQQLKKGA